MIALAMEPSIASDSVVEAIKLMAAFTLLLTALIPAARESLSKAKKKAVPQSAIRGKYSSVMLGLWFFCMIGSGLSVFFQPGAAVVLLAGAFVFYSVSFKFDQRPIERGQITNLVVLALLVAIGFVMYVLFWFKNFFYPN